MNKLLLLLLLWAPLVTPAEPTRWQLTLKSFSAAQGHTPDPESYIDRWRVNGGVTYAECVQIGNEALKDFQPGRIEGSPTLPGFECSPL